MARHAPLLWYKLVARWIQLPTELIQVIFASALLCTTSHLPHCEKSPSLRMLEAQHSTGFGVIPFQARLDALRLVLTRGGYCLEEIKVSSRLRQGCISS